MSEVEKFKNQLYNLPKRTEDISVNKEELEKKSIVEKHSAKSKTKKHRHSIVGVKVGIELEGSRLYHKEDNNKILNLSWSQEKAMTALYRLTPPSKSNQFNTIKLSEYFKMYGLKPTDSTDKYRRAFEALYSLDIKYFNYDHKFLKIENNTELRYEKLFLIIINNITFNKKEINKDDPIGTLKKAEINYVIKPEVFRGVFNQYYIKSLTLLDDVGKVLKNAVREYGPDMIKLHAMFGIVDNNIAKNDMYPPISIYTIIERLKLEEQLKQRGFPYMQKKIVQLLDYAKSKDLEWILDYKIDEKLLVHIHLNEAKFSRLWKKDYKIEQINREDSVV